MGDTAFFQIAVGLIPVLLFGGFLFGRDHEPDRAGPFRRTDGAALLGIVILGLLAIIAETVAIGGAVGVEPRTPGKVLVIAIILIGMLLVVLRGVLPRALHLRAQAHGGTAPLLVVAVLVVVPVAFIVAGGVSAVQVNKAIQIGQSSANAREAEHLQGQIEEIRHREEGRRRRINDLFFEWEKIPFGQDHHLILDRIHVREIKTEIGAEERAEREDLDHMFELERRIRRLGF